MVLAPMNGLQFTASLVASLAWPVAVVVIALVFRAQLRQLLSRPLRRVRAGPVEMEFDRLLSEVEVAVQPVPATTRVTQPGGVEVESLESLAATSPIAAVLDAHALVEQDLRDRVRAADPGSGDTRIPMGALIRRAQDLGVITPETAQAVQGITVMRNLAARGRVSEVSEERARDYLALVGAVLFALG